MNPAKTAPLPGVEILAAPNEQFDEILTPDALKFVVELHRRFGSRRNELLADREKVQARLDAG
jgi:malate synthase